MQQCIKMSGNTWYNWKIVQYLFPLVEKKIFLVLELLYIYQHFQEDPPYNDESRKGSWMGGDWKAKAKIALLLSDEHPEDESKVS